MDISSPHLTAEDRLEDIYYDCGNNNETTNGQTGHVSKGQGRPQKEIENDDNRLNLNPPKPPPQIPLAEGSDTHGPWAKPGLDVLISVEGVPLTAHRVQELEDLTGSATVIGTARYVHAGGVSRYLEQRRPLIACSCSSSASLENDWIRERQERAPHRHWAVTSSALSLHMNSVIQ